MKLLSCVALLFLLPLSGWGQDLLKERIWKISSKKRAIFLDKGVFHSDNNPVHQNLISVRSSFVKSRGFERIVLDFSSAKPPKVYGLISTNKIYMDLFNTSMGKNIQHLEHVKYVKNLDFYPIDSKNLSVELNFNKKLSFDIFYLENPGRIVIDVKQ